MVTLHLGKKDEIVDGEMIGRFRRAGEESWNKGYYAHPYNFRAAGVFHESLARTIADTDGGIAAAARACAEVRIVKAYGDFNPQTGYLRVTHQDADGVPQYVFVRLNEIRQVWSNGFNVADYTYWVSPETAAKISALLMDVCGVVYVPPGIHAPYRITNAVDNLPVPGPR
jgi:hypothetical protein